MFFRFTNWIPESSYRQKIAELESRDFNAMIWTYHFAYDNQGWPSLKKTAKLIKEIQADVVGFLETDASRPYMGSNDLAQWLAEELNMYVDFGPPTKSHTWGSFLLSRYPIKESKHHLLPSPEGELAPGISAILDINGRDLGVIVTHMGNDRDDLDRRLQTEVLSNISAAWFQTRPEMGYILLAYVTSRPGSRDYKHFVTKGHLKDIDPGDKDRFCEYIFYNRLVRLGYARISHGGLTDTEIQVGRFRIAKADSGGEFMDNERVVTDLDLVSPEQRFNPVFGEYTEGHYYANQHHFHMGTPKYFFPKPLKSTSEK